MKQRTELSMQLYDMLLERGYHEELCDIITTKAVPQATERIKALRELGFVLTDKMIVGHDGTKYGDYYILENK